MLSCCGLQIDPFSKVFERKRNYCEVAIIIRLKFTLAKVYSLIINLERHTLARYLFIFET